MIRYLLLAFSLFAFTYFFALPTPVHAQAQAWGGCVVNNVATLQCIPVVFNNVVRGALIFAGAIATILIVYGGIRLINSGGDAKQIQAARQIITYAIIGLLFILSSFGIIFFISFLTGAHCIETLSFTSCK